MPEKKLNKDILIIDSTLRDGSHAIKHQLNEQQIAAYASAADKANIPIIMVGHGNGLGASSLQIGESLISDKKMVETARASIQNSKLGVFTLPGLATVKRDLSMAIDIGVDVVCVASHCTEADTTQRHVEYARSREKSVYGCLMMTHMASAQVLVEECLKLQRYGAEGIILMDSAGAYLPEDVSEKISLLTKSLDIQVGFHAHNNLGMATGNSVEAVKSGATILDTCARGFGAGAGNSQLEVLVAVLGKMGFSTGIDLYKVLDAADVAEAELMKFVPYTNSVNIVSGLAGVFSGFVKHVERISTQYGVDPKDVFFELGRRQVIGGQEDVIIEVAMSLVEKNDPKHFSNEI